MTSIALSFITFSVSGTLRWKRVRELGKAIVWITVCEAEFAFLVTFAGVLVVAPLLITDTGAQWMTTFVPIALLMGCLAARTDPSATLFNVLGRYTEELVFVLFFTLSGMHLDFSVLVDNVALVGSLGKGLGAITGATLAKTSGPVRRYVVGGLIPQGGIVIGLALLIKQNPAFGGIADIVISVIIGATVIHELLGPILSKVALGAAGEIPAQRVGS